MALSTPNINNTFFEGSYKHAWKGTIPPGLSEAEVDFILDMSPVQKDAKILDLMCGYGRHALELARRDCDVTAVDNLDEYIDEIEANALKQNLPVRTMKADVLGMELGENYDAAICMGNSFAFFSRPDAVSILKNISAHLNPGGILIINSWMIAEIALKHFSERFWHYADDYKCIVEYKYQFYPSRIESKQTIIAPDGSVELLEGIDYIFTLDELEAMFNEAGLRTKELYSTPRKRKFSFGDARIYMVVEKSAN
jgi:SAM-dependent methyltransferase